MKCDLQLQYFRIQTSYSLRIPTLLQLVKTRLDPRSLVRQLDSQSKEGRNFGLGASTLELSLPNL